MKLFFSVFLSFFLLFVQNKTNAQQTGEWQQYLSSHLKTNVPKKNGAPQGIYTVTASFMIDSTGKIYDIKIDHDPGYGTAEEVLRVLKKAPRWPAEIATKEAAYRHKQNINFTVN